MLNVMKIKAMLVELLALVGRIRQGTGAILGSGLARLIQKRWSFGQVIIGSVWFYVCVFPLLAVADTALLLGVVTALAFTVVPIYNVTQASYRGALIPAELQGRVNSCYRQLLFGAQPVGALATGFLLEWIGSAYIVGCFALWIALWAVLAAINQSVRHAPSLSALEATMES